MTVRETDDYDLDGSRIVYEDFAIPPSISDLCRELSITRDTFAEYSAREDYADVCAWAKIMIESWLERQLSTRDRVEGIKFNLSCNYDWTPAERREVELGSQTRSTIEAAAVPMAERLELIQTVFGEISGLRSGRGGLSEDALSGGAAEELLPAGDADGGEK